MITQDRLKSLLHYDPDTGLFMWIVSRGRAKAGTWAHTFAPTGYIHIGINRKVYYAHRLAWLYMTGEWPTMLDHIDRDKTNNRWTNLRLSNYSHNAHNQAKCDSYKPWRHGNKFGAAIKKEGIKKHIGYFDTREEAIQAYQTELKGLS